MSAPRCPELQLGWLRVTPCWALEYLKLEDLLPRWFHHSCVWNLCWDDYKTELSQDSKLNHLYMTSPCGLCFSHSLGLSSEKEFLKSELKETMWKVTIYSPLLPSFRNHIVYYCCTSMDKAVTQTYIDLRAHFLMGLLSKTLWLVLKMHRVIGDFTSILVSILVLLSC